MFLSVFPIKHPTPCVYPIHPKSMAPKIMAIVISLRFLKKRRYSCRFSTGGVCGQRGECAGATGLAPAPAHAAASAPQPPPTLLAVTITRIRGGGVWPLGGLDPPPSQGGGLAAGWVGPPPAQKEARLKTPDLFDLSPPTLPLSRRSLSKDLYHTHPRLSLTPKTLPLLTSRPSHCDITL